MQDDPNTNQPINPFAWSPVADATGDDLHPQTTKRGNLIDPADPGSPFSRVLALFVCILVVATVIVWQNTGDELKFKYLLHKPQPIVELKADEPAPGNFGQIDPAARLFMRGLETFKPALEKYPIMEQLDPGGSGSFINEDRVRLIMLAGEYEGDEPALDRIKKLRDHMAAKASDPDHPVPTDDLIVKELNTLETIYTTGIDALEDTQREQLKARYGLVGKVALTHGLDDTDPARAKLIDGGVPIVFFLLIAGLMILLVPLLGLVVLIFGIVLLASGRLKFRNHVPTKGGSVFLETYGVFVGSFIVLSIAAFFVANSSRPELASLSLLVQWLLVLTVMWGLVRGMKLNTWRHAIGWHAGEGVFKEIGCGILAYLASIPLFLVGTIITLLLLTLKASIQTGMNHGVPLDPEPITNPIFEIIASGNFVTIALLFVLATTWAPIVEEAIFRGALFRHLRGSLHWVFAALVSALLFAFMHDYGPLMVSPIIALGFMFAFMREWRGSLIASMTAHFLHNFTLIGMMIIFIQLIKDPM